MTLHATDTWFVAEVLPLEAALTRYLRRNWRDSAEIADLRQEVYVRVYEAGLKSRPAAVKAFVFATARNLLIDRVRRARVVSIEAVTDLEALNVAIDEPSSDRVAIGRQELRRVMLAVDTLPPRCREVVLKRKLEGLSQREVARHMGITEDTVERQLAKGVRVLATALFGSLDAARERDRAVGYDDAGADYS